MPIPMNYPKVFRGKQSMSPQGRQFLAGQVQQIGQQALQGQQSRQADYQRRLGIWKKNKAKRQAEKQQKKEKKGFLGF